MLRKTTLLSLIFLVLFGAACRKKAPIPPPPSTPASAGESAPAPAPAKPEIQSFEVAPGRITVRQTARLSWNVTGADDVQISPTVGNVSARGEREVSPTETTLYTLKATSAGGDVSRSVQLFVEPAAPADPAPRAAVTTLSERLAREVSDVYFGYDRSALDADAMATLQRNTEALRRLMEEFPGAEIVMEGHCDERGSAEYNLGLGDRRASAAKEHLERLGMNTSRIRSVSYGKERPQCSDATEDCWRRNRRVHFSAGN